MEFGLLGPLSVTERGVDRTPTAPKQRQMLALLLFNANRVVTTVQFVDELWEFAPPPSAVAAVHTYVRQLRRTLPGPRLITRDQGYRVEVRPGELDLAVFRARVADARTTADPAVLARRLRAALDLWRAALLVDVTPGPLLRGAIAAVERDRLATVCLRIDAELHLGGHHDLIGELSGLTHRHPGHEGLAAHLMTALYRSGRQADALTAFHRLGRGLAEESGSPPSPRLHRLYTDILSADPRLEGPVGLGPALSLDLVAQSPLWAAHR
ncbi:AfsR/SARP family transcriptional regulator [Actinokineospora sp. NBRC 105648]|uniref:AfsR/SARP family transcriptional regulator n=1 Tax=Actinokineospora sp. NBRC 105648 TaxID=3032206 RepID=UPI0024A0C44E|nr:AfsR/SARP family transcriptional regulator [Actinokineospora sp. NBRC 105648]GLZ43348.1 hypothetical protein Acsp05_69720 [Actinokineospora sp. NBRC 105648]